MFLLERLIAIIAPHECFGCGAEGLLLCKNCRSEYLSPVPPRCYRCHVATENFKTCKRCKPSTPLSHVWVATEYEDVTKRLIHDFKFARAQAAGAVIARHMHQSMPAVPKESLLMPVPTATRRVRQRGYDQSELIAQQLGTLKGLEVVCGLSRTGQSRQVGANRARRKTQLLDAYRVKRSAGNKIGGMDVVLVDDITTTGSTLEAAAVVLKTAGAKSVSAIVFAQKQ